MSNISRIAPPLRISDVAGNLNLLAIKRFASKYRKTKSCWEWCAGKFSNGYGIFHINRRPFGAHRIAYLIFNGEIDPGLVIDHTCRNRGCVNPGHLEQVSLQENVYRGESRNARNRRKTHCKRGHEFNKQNTYLRKDRPGHRHCRACMGGAND